MTIENLDVPIQGMCCAEEATAVRKAIASLPGVASVDVLLTAEVAKLRIDPAKVDIAQIRKAVERAGCSVPNQPLAPSPLPLFESMPPRLQLLELAIGGMCCAEEADDVRDSISSLRGVESVEVLLTAEIAKVKLDPTLVDMAQIRKAVESAGCSLTESPGEPTQAHKIELSIEGMCCAEEAQEVESALNALPGVRSAEVFLASEKAVIQFDGERIDMSQIRKAVASAGCSVEGTQAEAAAKISATGRDLVRSLFILFGVIFGAVLFIVVAGELLGLFDAATESVPWPVWAAIILVGGYPVLRNVARAALRRRITSHTLMTVGLIAAVAVGEWPAAVLLVFFMRIGEHVESFTTDRVRRAVKELTAATPRQARIDRDGIEVMVPVAEVAVGESVVVRPGEQVPVDGEVIGGEATINQAAITGESMPVEVSAGSAVFAATLCQLGMLRIRTTRVGADTTFGRMIKLVEEAEANRADVQRFADKVSGYYLPVVATVSVLTFVISGNALAAAAVLVVACSCAFAIATPIAMMASIAAAAQRGLLIKGGKYLELLAHADVVLLDKTGTLTLGQPQITDVVTLNGMTDKTVLQLAATAERHSEHPLAEAVRAKAMEQGAAGKDPDRFEAIPGIGVRASVNGASITVGSHRLAANLDSLTQAIALEQQGKTLLFVLNNDEPVAILAASDTLRPEVPAALTALRRLGVKRIELLTGDNERTAAALASALGIEYRANLLPEDKISAVKAYQAQGQTVVMVGDGVNDAPALAQADVGIAMGAAGSDIAIEAAHIALMREDWRLVPEVFEISRRTMNVVRLNIGFTAAYNVVGLALAAIGLLPLVIAASAQSLPDIGMLGNSSRLLRNTKERKNS